MWVIPGTFFVLWFIRKYWEFSQHLPHQSRKHFFLAAFLYIGGALIMEMIGSYIAEAQGQQNLLYAMTATSEEVMEMAGAIVFIYGLLCYLRRWLERKLNLEITIGK